MGLQIQQTVLVEAVFHSQLSAAEVLEWLDGLDQLISRQQGFYFMAKTQPNTEFDPDYRRLQGRWYKQQKLAFQHCCLGLVRLVADEAERIRLDSPALHAAWGVPYHVTTSREQGLAWIAAQMVAR